MTPSAVFLLVALSLALLAGAALLRAWARLRRSQQRAEDFLEQLGVESLDLADGLEPSGRRAGRRAPLQMDSLLYDLERNLDLRVAPRQLFVVHGFPKTGNSTLAATVGALDICDLLHGGHHFSDAGVAALHRAVGNIADPALRSRQLAYYYECTRFNRIFHDQRRLQEQIRADGDAPMRPFVVTSMRDPIQIFLSGMLFVHACLGEPPAPPTAEVLLEAAFGKEPRSAEATFWRDLWFKTICGRIDDGAPWYLEIDRWFEGELGAVFGIDAFSTPFPHERGWTSLESDAARGLLLRQEDFDRLAEILSAFFGLPDGLVRVVDDNRSEGRPNADLYGEIRESFRVPAEQLDAVYATRAARHFYSPAEIEGMKARWGA